MSVPLGTIIYIAVKPIFKIYLIIGVGVLMARLNVLTVDTSRNISSLAVMVLLPALAFDKIVTNIDNSDIKQIATIVIVSFFMMGSGSIGTFLIGAALGCPVSWYGGLLSCGLLPNISDLPIAYLQSMESSNILKHVDKGVSYVCIFLALQMIVQFNFGGFKLIELDFRKQLNSDDDEDDLEQGSQIGDSDAIVDGSTPAGETHTPGEGTSSLQEDSAGSTLLKEALPSSESTSGEENAKTGDARHRTVRATSPSPRITAEGPQEEAVEQEETAPISPTSTISSLDSIIDNASVNPRNKAPEPLYRGDSVGGHSALSRLASRLSYSSALSRKASVPNSILSTTNSRTQAPENMDDIVRVYSHFNELKQSKEEEKERKRMEKLESGTSSTSSSSTSLGLEKQSGLGFVARKKYQLQKAKRGLRKTKKTLRHLDYWKIFKEAVNVLLTSTLKPCSVAVVLSIIVCMIPWVKALFVFTDQATMPNAPDHQPALSFLMDFTSYIGAAEVPIGLLLLGGTIGRLSLSKLPAGTWRTPVGVTFFKLFVFPVIGCALNSKLHKDGLFYNEDILYFICNINFCLPPATSLIYITAFYTPVGSKSTLQMDCLALAYIFHYICLVVCLPFVTSYTMKVALGY